MDKASNMTLTPPSNNSSNAGNSPDTYRVVRKRNRIPLSCAPCRQRKLKCNRQQPCDNCSKRGDSHLCTYAAPAARKKGSQSQAGANATPDDMQNRIDRLESLVLSLMTNGSQSAGPSAAAHAISAASSSIGSGSLGPNLDSTLDDQLMDADTEHEGNESETDGVTQSFGILKVDPEKQKTFYIGEAHWAALLSEIGEVKNYFTSHKKEYEAQMEKVAQARQTEQTDVGSGPALLFGASIPPPRAEILSQLPSKYTCDILIARYFNTFDPPINILHGPAFKRQYEAHWQDPSRTSIVWIAMLFAMIRLAMISYGRDGDEPPEFKGKCQDMASTYRTQMAHCLITADYTKPHNFIIETLIFHLHAEYTSNKDSEASVWVLVGMIARLAMRMGYHRDSKLFPNISPFQGEMRRRVWTFVRSADVLFSFQFALPSMIRLGDSDTDLPRNIYDNEFDEDSKELPPPRPASEATPVSYLIAKGRLAFGFGKVLEDINGVHKHSYEEILKIDKGLQEVYRGIPDHLKMRPMSEQQLAPMTLIMARFSLASVYHKSQCVLHRRFMKFARGNNKFMHSRRMCIDSAMQLLSFHALQHHQSQEKGRMRTMRKYVNSLTTHDFLLAASVLGMDLYKHRDRAESDISTPSTSVSGGSVSQGSASVIGSTDSAYVPGLQYTRDDLLKTLEQSREIWHANRDTSMEAYKASEMLHVLLTYIKQPYSPSQANLPMPSLNSSSMMGTPNNNNDEQTAAMTLGMLQSGGMASNSAQAAAAAHLAQQAQQQSQVWDSGNGTSVGGSMMNAFLTGDQNNQFFNNQTFNSTGYYGEGNNTGFPLFGAAGSADVSMNFDWDNWDQYMQSNLGLDPASNLWSNASPNNSNVFTQATPASDASSTNPPTTANEGSFAMNSGFFAQSNPGIGADLPKQEGVSDPNSNGANGTNMTGDGGDTFMGVQTPGPGGVGIGGWKWTVMSGDKS